MPAILNSKIKKILLVFSSLILLFSSLAQPLVPTVHAKSTWFNQNPTDWYLKVYDTNESPESEIFGERYTAAQVQWIFWSLGSTVLNAMVFGHTEIYTCLLSPAKDTCLLSVVNNMKDIFSEIGEMSHSQSTASSFVAVVGTNPISGVYYTKQLISKFNPVTTVNAQGFGFNTGANSIVKLWQISRNFAFSLLIIAVIAMAFMIMFRVKISPQVVITVQSALPKLIAALVLITFSYAIAGFMIDLMYVVIGLIATIISGADLTKYTPLQLFVEFTTGENAIGLLFEFWIAFMVTAVLSIFSSLNPVTWIGGILLFIFAFFFIIVAIVYTFKILALILKNFVNIILAIITGPIEILLGTITQGSGFVPWLRKLLSYLAVYPVMALLFFFAFFFLAQAFHLSLIGKLTDFLNITYLTWFPFNPNLTIIGHNSWDPPLSTFVIDSQALLWAIVAYVIITLVPKTVEIIQGFISGKPFAYGSAVGEATGVLTSVGRGGLSAGVGIVEARRKINVPTGQVYDPHWVTKTLQTVGLIK